MQKIFLIVLVMCNVFGSDLIYAPSFEQAKFDAKKNDKLILLMYTMKGCPACEYMKDVTFENETIKQDLLNNFIIVERDAKDKNQLVNGFEAFATPTIYFTDASGKKLARQIVGATTAKIFKEKLREVKNSLRAPLKTP